jgi:RNA polymerase sigma factor (sigma-70 family)
MQKLDQIINNISKNTIYRQSVIDKEDLRQAALIAVMNVNKKIDGCDDNSGYLYTSIKRSIQEEANKFYNVFSCDRKKINNIKKLRIPKNSIDICNYTSIKSYTDAEESSISFFIEDVLSSEIEKKLFDLKFVRGMSLLQIKKETGLSEKSIKNLNSKIENKILKAVS